MGYNGKKFGLKVEHEEDVMEGSPFISLEPLTGWRYVLKTLTCSQCSEIQFVSSISTFNGGGKSKWVIKPV